jgi:hypothetical protein
MTNIPDLIGVLHKSPKGEELAKALIELLADADDEDWILVLVKLGEATRERRFTLSSPVRPTEAESVVKSIVLNSDSILTAEDIVQLAPEYPRSLKHRSGASSVLNSLVSKGELGKLTIGRETYFASLEEAIRQSQVAWMREHPYQSPEHINPSAIASMTGLSTAQVIRVLSEMF